MSVIVGVITSTVEQLRDWLDRSVLLSCGRPLEDDRPVLVLVEIAIIAVTALTALKTAWGVH